MLAAIGPRPGEEDRSVVVERHVVQEVVVLGRDLFQAGRGGDEIVQVVGEGDGQRRAAGADGRACAD